MQKLKIIGSALTALFFLNVVSAQEPPQESPPPRPSGGGADPSGDAFDLGSPPALPEGMTEEEMWPAATAEGWRKPCLVHWQRTFADALQVATAEQRPLLVCVNMDGEIASEHFAGVRYRDEWTTKLMERYACVVASVYRHTPRDYDELGNRVPCPRFGTVTCGEHIEAERELYEKYFDGRRISPRHIVLDPNDESETYDVYFSWDTQTVFTTFVKGVEGWPEPPEDEEPTLVGLAQSPDVADREALERMYVTESRETKREILRALTEERRVDQTEVLRTAIFALDAELASLARRALALCETEGSLDLMAEALKAPLPKEDREVLLAAVARLAKTSPRARTLLALHSGLGTESRLVDAKLVTARASYDGASRRSVGVQQRAETAARQPSDPSALLDLAEGFVSRADEVEDEVFRGLLLRDAEDTLDQAVEAGGTGVRVAALEAVLAARAGQRQRARERAVAAVEAGLLTSPQALELSDRARADVLRAFADSRRFAIRRAYRGTGEWPAEWLSDLNAAYAALGSTDEVTDSDLASHQDFLRWIGATSRANAVLDAALARFPDSALLHERVRGRLLWEGGPALLERVYAERLEALGERGKWFAGYASLVAAEQLRRRSEFVEAEAAYVRALGRFEADLEVFPDDADATRHFMALVQAGRARLMLEAGELAEATETLLAAYELRAESAESEDGLGLTPLATAKMLHARLLEAGDEVRAAQVEPLLAG